MEPEERAQAGVFLAFQYPVEIPGVTNAYFLRAAYNEIRKATGLEEIDSMDFLDLLEEKLKVVEWGPEIMSRAVNSGLLRRREEAQRDPPAGGARAEARHSRRDRLGARHRRAPDRGRPA